MGDLGEDRAASCEKLGLNKGAWMPSEDARLVAYIQRHGHGNWRALPKEAGLARCGKSCRLRWMNYLRPGLKRGNLSKEEEETIIRLHKQFGNKWSKMAAFLPGRTDNEIKNVWNTHLKKRFEPREPRSSSRRKPKQAPNPSQSGSCSDGFNMISDRSNVESELHSASNEVATVSMELELAVSDCQTSSNNDDHNAVRNRPMISSPSHSRGSFSASNDEFELIEYCIQEPVFNIEDDDKTFTGLDELLGSADMDILLLNDHHPISPGNAVENQAPFHLDGEQHDPFQLIELDECLASAGFELSGQNDCQTPSACESAASQVDVGFVIATPDQMPGIGPDIWNILEDERGICPNCNNSTPTTSGKSFWETTLEEIDSRTRVAENKEWLVYLERELELC